MKRLQNFIFFFFLFLSFQNVFTQFQIPKTPKFQTSVYDKVGLLSIDHKKRLENKLVKYSDSTSTQIVIAIINSTQGEEIGFLATKWAHKWGVGGSKEKDNGVFILLAQNDKKVTIRSGYGVEHLLTDYKSRQIIEYDILPFFKQGNYYGGLNAGTDAIFKILSGAYHGSRKQGPNKDFGFIVFLIIFILFFIIVTNNRNNRGGNNRHLDSRDLFETIILSNSGRGSYGGGTIFGGSSSGSSGGFGGGFGGGGFGGGGATGGW